jgi:transcriptional regulator with XRE-family HTH domain
MALAIGAKIKEVMKTQGLGYKELGALINRHEKTVANILNRKTIDTELLLSICKALQHDFFSYYYLTDPLKALKEEENRFTDLEMLNLKKLLDEKITYIQIQDKYVQSQEEVIRLLKEKELSR